MSVGSTVRVTFGYVPIGKLVLSSLANSPHVDRRPGSFLYRVPLVSVAHRWVLQSHLQMIGSAQNGVYTF